MDGVLVDGEPLHFAAINQLLEEEGRVLTLEQYRPYMGTKAGWVELIDDLGLQKPAEYYAPRYNELILAQYRDHSTPLPGACELVRSLREHDVPVGLASSSIAPWVSACLGRLGLESAFDPVVTGSDVREGKPSPEIYLQASRRLGLPPARVLAIEDAPAGIASARAAGMTCWAVLTPYTEGLDLGAANRVLPSLAGVRPDDIVKVAA